jgi:hypothetical protein
MKRNKNYFLYLKRHSKRGRIIVAKNRTGSQFVKRMENGRLRLLPANEASDTVEKLASPFKEAAKYMIDNRFPGILSDAR